MGDSLRCCEGSLADDLTVYGTIATSSALQLRPTPTSLILQKARKLRICQENQQPK